MKIKLILIKKSARVITRAPFVFNLATAASVAVILAAAVTATTAAIVAAKDTVAIAAACE